MTELTQSELKKLLSYDPDSGIFTWKVSSGTKPAGSEAGGHTSTGYRAIRVNGKKYLAHRLAFLYVLGAMPAADVDHINEVKSDNRWINLRPATRSQNQANRGANTNNTTGLKGLSWHSRDETWRVDVKGNDQRHYSSHHCKLDAVAELHRQQKALHGAFVNHG